MPSALVLAGGGVAGIAWELGVLRGILDVHPGLEEVLLGTDVIVGTSAGSTVAAQLGGGTPLDALYDAQLDAASAEIAVDVDLMGLFASFEQATAGVTDPAELRRRVGALALATETVPEADRRAAVAARLPVQQWSERDIRIPAVDAQTGDVVVFTGDSGVDLVDAVTASCAVPGVWPPATVNGRRYVDGGVRSSTNADLAAGCDRVLIVLPNLPDTPIPWTDLAAETVALAPARVVTVYADDASIAAFGTNPLAAGTRAPSAHAGGDVGRRHADAVAALFG